ncbi:MAG TPA: MATE family efflux transporter [Candidatus Udaeobacter sp.]|nr:MATE family efflux transporter [Candidatus Udaeobacter sp.]
MKAEALTRHDKDGASHLQDILQLAVPAMLALASVPSLNIGDTAMIGRLGVEPLAARAVGAALLGAIYWIFAFLTFGTTTLVGHQHGAREFQACGATYVHALLLGLLGGLGISVAGLLLAPNLYRLMGAAPAVIDYGVPYFRIVISSAPFTLIFFASVGFFRGVQDTQTPMLIAFLVSGLNLVADYLLIYGGFGFPAMGLNGAAIAAWLAQFAGAIVSLCVFFYGTRYALYRPPKWLIKTAPVRPLLRIGHHLAVRTGALRFSLIVATSSAARMDTAVLSAHEIAFQLFMLCSDVIDGLAVAGQALAAKYLGANRNDAAHRMGKTLMICGAVAGSLFAVMFLGGQEWIVPFFTKSSHVQSILSGGIFLLVALFQPFNGIAFVLDGWLIGARDTRFLMWAMLVGALGIFVPLSWISLQREWGLPGIWTGVSALMMWRLATNFHRFWTRSAWM